MYFNFFQLMMHANPTVRPSSTSIFNHPVLASSDSKTKSQLSYELNLERKKNELLMRKLQETKKLLAELPKTPRKLEIA